jgi:hypothetical protein
MELPTSLNSYRLEIASDMKVVVRSGHVIAIMNILLGGGGGSALVEGMIAYSLSECATQRTSFQGMLICFCFKCYMLELKFKENANSTLHFISINT